MSRRPYIRPMPANWFMDKPAYRFYALRELSCVFNLLYSINLFAGLWQLSRNAEAWTGWLNFQSNPAMVVFAVVTLAMTVLHAVTFIDMAPRVAPQQVRKMVPDNTVRGVMFAGLGIVSIVIVGITAMGAF